MREWYALFEARWRRWYGVSGGDRWANLGGQLVIPADTNRQPFWVWNAPMRQLYCSSYHLSPSSAPAYLDALERYQIKYLYGYSSSMNTLAQGVLREGRKLKMKVAIANAKVAYQEFKDFFSASLFKELEEKGARVQRPLWASTGTKSNGRTRSTTV